MGPTCPPPRRERRLKRINRRLRERVHRDRRGFVGLGVLAVGLISALAYNALRAPDPVRLGSGIAGTLPEEVARPPAVRVDPEEPPLEAIGGGEASWYGEPFAGRPTASGEIFDPSQLTAAHRTLPLGSRLRVTHVGSGRSVVVRVNDRGPYAGDRVLDLSEAAASILGMIETGTAEVRLELLRD